MQKKNLKVPVEVYSRVVGYFRPVNQWNKGKQEEFSQRKEFAAESYCKNLKMDYNEYKRAV
ncbi:MAG: anaerobic ribonucleoside-triphosphate reductase [Spirochaetota bacterium]